MIQKLVHGQWWQMMFSLGVAGITCAFVLVELIPLPASAFSSDNRPPEVGFPPDDFVVNESDGSGIVTVEISAAPAAGAEVVVSYLTVPGTAISGAVGDYIDTAGVLTFTHSSPTTQMFQVEIVDDNVYNEPDETINLILYMLTPTTATLGRNVSILIIADDDVMPASQLLYIQPILAPDMAMLAEPKMP